MEPLPWYASEYEAFRVATREAVDGPHRGQFCKHCCRITEVRQRLMKDRPTMLRLLELRRNPHALLKAEMHA